MTRDELEHAIRASCDVAGDNAVWVFGPQSLLGQHPEAPEALRFSVEVDPGTGAKEESLVANQEPRLSRSSVPL